MTIIRAKEFGWPKRCKRLRKLSSIVSYLCYDGRIKFSKNGRKTTCKSLIISLSPESFHSRNEVAMRHRLRLTFSVLEGWKNYVSDRKIWKEKMANIQNVHDPRLLQQTFGAWKLKIRKVPKLFRSFTLIIT